MYLCMTLQLAAKAIIRYTIWKQVHNIQCLYKKDCPKVNTSEGYEMLPCYFYLLPHVTYEAVFL